MKKLLGLLLMLVSSSGYSQNLSVLEDELNTYFKQRPEERLYVHLSSSEVLAGERLWFSIYPYSPLDGKSPKLSRVAYVELLNQDGEQISKARIPMDTSGGDGYIDIPAVTASGYYQVRAYTQWMRNFDIRGFYQGKVKIINTFRQLGLTSVLDSSKVVPRFFPEGGDLIAGNLARVGVLSENSLGKGASMAATILNRDSVVMGAFQTDQHGIGMFEFKPESGQSYMAVWLMPDSTVRRVDLPVVRPTGVSFRVNETTNGYEVNVSERGTIPGNLYLTVVSGGQFVLIKSQVSNANGNTFTLTNNELNPGVNQVTLLNNEGVPVCERLIYVDPPEQISFDVATLKSIYSEREQIKIQLGSADIQANASVSVHIIDNNDELLNPGFHAYRWLVSETSLPPRIVTAFSEGQIQDRNQLLLIYGWRRYDMEAIRQVKKNEVIPELRTLVLTGRLTASALQDPVFVGYADSLTFGRFVSPKEDGTFSMELPNLSGQQEIIASSSADAITVDDPFETNFASMVFPHFSVEASSGPYYAQRSQGLQVQNIFKKPSREKLVSTESFYGEPTVRYYLDDYTRFPVMEEVMREYVYGVLVRKRGDQYSFKVIDDARNETMEDDPLILLDGIPVSSANDIIALDPARIKRIDVLRGGYGSGAVKADGIIAFYSYKSDMAGYRLPDTMLKTAYQGMQQHKQFYLPNYNEGNSSRYPDFRSLLYWNPRVDVDGIVELDFPASNVTGTFLIEIQGVSYLGEPFTATTQFKVE